MLGKHVLADSILLDVANSALDAVGSLIPTDSILSSRLVLFFLSQFYLVQDPELFPEPKRRVDLSEYLHLMGSMHTNSSLLNPGMAKAVLKPGANNAVLELLFPLLVHQLGMWRTRSRDRERKRREEKKTGKEESGLCNQARSPRL